MNSSTAIALAAFIAWALLLLLVMELIRTWLVMTRQAAPNGFLPDNSNLSPFMQRLARAHANCIEGLPVFGGLLLLALLMERSDITDGLAYVFLLARLLQSSIHLISVSPTAVTLRFSAFFVQMLIGAYWAAALLAALLA